LLDPNKTQIKLTHPIRASFELNLDGVGWSGRGVVFIQYYPTLIQYIVGA